MSESTSISDLPTDPVGNSINNNISLVAAENIKIQEGASSVFSLDQTTISQIVSGLQQASITGITQLPSRDIPMNSAQHTTDPQVQPNYIPSPHSSNIDYIKNYEQNDDIIQNYDKRVTQQNSIDAIYNDIQTPLLLVVLYFLFQLPFFRKLLYQYFPALFAKDGNTNIYGLLFTSALFGLIFYILDKVTYHFNVF